MEHTILDAAGFDAWQAQYEADVAACEAVEDYPFAGYTELQQQIFDIVHAREGVSVLDLGCGTGKMAARLLEAGHPVTAADFSDNMLAAAQLFQLVQILPDTCCQTCQSCCAESGAFLICRRHSNLNIISIQRHAGILCQLEQAKNIRSFY